MLIVNFAIQACTARMPLAEIESTSWLAPNRVATSQPEGTSVQYDLSGSFSYERLRSVADAVHIGRSGIALVEARSKPRVQSRRDSLAVARLLRGRLLRKARIIC